MMDSKTIFERFTSITQYSNDTMVPTDVMCRVLNLSMEKYGEISEKQLIDAMNEHNPGIVDTFFGHSRFVGIDIGENFRHHLRNEDAAKIETGVNDYVRTFTRRDPILKLALEENFGATNDGSGVVESKKMLGILYSWLNNYPTHNRLRSILGSPDFMFSVHAFLGTKVEQTVGKSFVVKGIVPIKKYINGVLIPTEESTDTKDLNLGLLKKVFEAHNVSTRKSNDKPKQTPKLEPATVVDEPKALPAKTDNIQPAKACMVADCIRGKVSDWRQVITTGFNEFMAWLELRVDEDSNSKITEADLRDTLIYWCDNVTKKQRATLRKASYSSIATAIELLKSVYVENNILDRSKLIDKIKVAGSNYSLNGYKLKPGLEEKIRKRVPIKENEEISKPLFPETGKVEKEVITYRESLVNCITMFVHANLKVVSDDVKIDTHNLYDVFKEKYGRPNGITCGYANFCKYLRKVIPYTYITKAYGKNPSYLTKYAWRVEVGEHLKKAEDPKPTETTTTVAKPVEATTTVQKPAPVAEPDVPKVADETVKPEPVKPAPIFKLSAKEIQAIACNVTGVLDMLDSSLKLSEEYNVTYDYLDALFTRLGANRLRVIFKKVFGDYEISIVSAKVYGATDIEGREMKIQYMNSSITFNEDVKEKAFKFKARNDVPYFRVMFTTMMKDIVKLINHYTAE